MRYEYGFGSNPHCPNIVSWREVGRVEKPQFIGSGTLEAESQTDVGTGRGSVQSGRRAASDGGIFYTGKQAAPGSFIGSSTSGKAKQRRETGKSEVFFDLYAQLTVGFIAEPGLSTDYVKEISDLQLSSGSDYYCFVRITNGAGLQSVGVSEPVRVDKSPPIASISAPESVRVDQGLKFTITANDDESGIARYRYAIWKVGEVSMDIRSGDVILASAGMPDFDDGIFILASGKKSPELSQPEILQKNEILEGGMPGGGQPSYKDLIEQGAPQMPVKATEVSPLSIIESTPPWIDSGWIDTSTGAPPVTFEKEIVITDYPKPGLEEGVIYRIRVWLQNGAGIQKDGGAVMISIIPSIKQKARIRMNEKVIEAPPRAPIE